MEIETISRDELKAKLDRGDDFRLVMALNEWAYNALHIPGSVRFDSIEQALTTLRPDEEIVVYCSDEACVGSQYAYKGLKDHGYEHVRRYAGGLSDWVEAGLPLEGTQARGR